MIIFHNIEELNSISLFTKMESEEMPQKHS